MNPGINILFYSRSCDTCKNLLKILQNENLLGYFKLYCVDGRYQELPKYITTVPTMIVSTINKPLVAAETFEWIKNMKFIKNQMIQDMNKKLIQQNLVNMTKTNLSGPLGFIQQEMNGYSDNYAFQDPNIDKAFPHSYLGLGEEDKNAIFTAPEQNKMSKDDQTKKIKEVHNFREQQDKEFSGIMKQQQLKALNT